jgi:hypothetical protein
MNNKPFSGYTALYSWEDSPDMWFVLKDGEDECDTFWPYDKDIRLLENTGWECPCSCAIANADGKTLDEHKEHLESLGFKTIIEDRWDGDDPKYDYMVSSF